MRVLAIILAQQAPAQLGRLVRRLEHCGIAAHVHVDRTVDQSAYAAACSDTDCQFVTDRARLRWGGYSVIRATLALMQAARATGFDRLLLLPDDAYPIKGARALQAALQTDGTMINVDSVDRHADAHRRIDGTFLLDFAAGAAYDRGRADLERLVDDELSASLGAVQTSVRMKRDAAFPWTYAKGSPWWCMDAQTVDRAFGFLAGVPQYTEWFRFSAVPDEAFFQTMLPVLGDVPYLNRTPVYTDWTRNPCPFTFTDPAEAESLIALPHLFAQRFAAQSGDLLDAIDALADADR